MNSISFKENDFIQKPALELLQKLGYHFLSPEEALDIQVLYDKEIKSL